MANSLLVSTVIFLGHRKTVIFMFFLIYQQFGQNRDLHGRLFNLFLRGQKRAVLHDQRSKQDIFRHGPQKLTISDKTVDKTDVFLTRHVIS